MTDRPALPDVLADPNYFPQEIHPGENRVKFLPTAQERLARPGFIDGRTDFSTGPAIEFPLDAVLAAARDLPPPPEPDRMIFHVSFCGSTLLARMLTLPGSAFALKEPNVLAWLADWKKQGGLNDPRFAPSLAWARASLRRRWQAGEPVLTKPSNWANNLLPEFMADRDAIRPLLVTMARRPFLIAVLRGGRDRLAFTARAAAHLADTPQSQSWLQAAIAGSTDPLTNAVRIAAVTLHRQMVSFAEAARGLPPEAVIDAADVTGDPVSAALAASRALALGIEPERLAAHAASVSGENAKNPGRVFAPSERAGEDDAVEGHHGAMLDAVLDWAEHELGPHPSLR